MMPCLISSFFRLVICALIGLATIASHSPVSAQDNPESAITGNSYTSPTFGYAVSWDEQVWAPTDEYASWNYTWLTLETASSSYSLEGLYAYYGDAVACFDYEIESLQEQLDVESLQPLEDSEGNPLMYIGDVWVSGMYGLPVEVMESGQETALYLECITLIPGYAVLIITSYLDRAAVDAQDSATLDVLLSVTLSPEDPSEPDLAEYDAYLGSVSEDLAAFWTDTFTELGYSFEAPNYDIVTYPTEVECGGDISVQEGANYCESSQTITVGEDEFLTEELPIGLGSAEFTLGHEMGHHVYYLLNLGSCDITDCQTQDAITNDELTANCLSGAWMQDAVATGFFDEQAVWRTEYGARFRIGTSPGDADHGTPEQGLAAFDAGYEGGITACGIE